MQTTSMQETMAETAFERLEGDHLCYSSFLDDS